MSYEFCLCPQPTKFQKNLKIQLNVQFLAIHSETNFSSSIETLALYFATSFDHNIHYMQNTLYMHNIHYIPLLPLASHCTFSFDTGEMVTRIRYDPTVSQTPNNTTRILIEYSRLLPWLEQMRLNLER